MIDILMTTFNRLEFTQKVIQHIYERTQTPFRLIVVDNASTDGTREYLQSISNMSNFKLKLLPKNMGLQASKNIGLEYVESKYFVNTDNDCLCPDLMPDWLSQLTELIDKRTDYAAIAMRPQILVGVGPIFRDAKDEVVENNVVGGSFRIMKTAWVKMAGGWRNDFENRGEEWEICNKLRKLGYKVGYAKNLFCYHMFGEKDWGYPDGVEHYHNPASAIYAKDEEYDPVTCEPKVRKNE